MSNLTLFRKKPEMTSMLFFTFPFLTGKQLDYKIESLMV